MKIKIVPDATLSADGKWIDIPAIDLSNVRSWIMTDRLIAPFVPTGYHLVAVGATVDGHDV
jgi:hypothetical protein